MGRRSLAAAVLGSIAMVACSGADRDASPSTSGPEPATVASDGVAPAADPAPDGWSEVPCREEEMSEHRALTLGRYGSDEWIDLAMLDRVDVVVRVSGVRVLGAERRLYADEDGWEDSQTEGGGALLGECVTWIEMDVAEVLFDDGQDLGALPPPPFLVNAVDTNSLYLVSVEAGFEQVAERTDELLFGLSRGPSTELVGEPGVSRAFSPVMIAAADAGEVFFPDVDVAREASARFAVVRDRLGADGIVDIVREFHADEDGVGRWREQFPDLYPPITEDSVDQ